MTENNDQDYSQGRREFFRSAMRTVSLAGIATLFAISRIRTRASGTNDKCVNHGVCSNCGVFDRCGLPQALCAKEGSARQHNVKKQSAGQ